MKKEPQILKTVLLELCNYDVIDFTQLEEIVKSHPEFTSFCIESVPYECGCYYECHCPREKLAFKGCRFEDETEYQQRLDQETKTLKAKAIFQKEKDLQILADLKKRYPDA